MVAENPFAPLGLPPQWSPAPLAWNLAKLRATGPAGAEVLILLIVHSTNGTQAYKFSPAEARALAEKILEQCTGIALVTGPEANGYQGPPRNREERRRSGLN